MFEGIFAPQHLLIVLAIALLVFGPKKLPELGKGLGEAMRGFKDGIKGTPDAAKETTINAAATPPVDPRSIDSRPIDPK